MLPTDAAVAANRFGLGALPGELKRLGNDARDALHAQLRGPAPVFDSLAAKSLQPSHELLATVIAQREALRKERSGGEPAVATIGRLLRETYLPAYVSDVAARFAAAVSSERSFLERLTHFWSNHFAVSVDKIAVLGLAGAMEREAIRPLVLGNFTDMLLAVERHPAMLLFLDNQGSIGPNSQAARLAAGRGREVGLNENLGREILELHTLGVEGGYTQADVQSLAAMITGWSVGGEAGRLRGGEPGRFFFRAAFHEPGAKTLLGKRYTQDGVAQGAAALRDLAFHPRTAQHLATKLARHFIADDPPAAAVERIARAYLKSQGDLPSTYLALIDSPEAWQAPLTKFKTPADFIHSSFRMLGMPPGDRARDLNMFELLGQRTFQPGSPAGWPDRSSDWDGSAALLKRLEWAQAAGQRLGSARTAAQMADAALGAALGNDTRRAIANAQDGAQALTLLLCAPEFMRR